MNIEDSLFLTEFANDIESIFGVGGILVLILLQALQIVVAVLPGGIVEIVGGMIYGTTTGLFISITGILLGSLTAFYIARRFGKKIIKKLVNPKQFEKYEALSKSRKFKTMVILFFFLPGIPKDVLIYVIGAVSNFKMGLLASVVRIPSIVVSVFAGSLFGSGNVKTAVITYGIFLFVGTIGVLLHNKIMDRHDRNL